MQADRDAAEALWSAEGVGQSMPDCWPEAFARHRIAERKAIVDWLMDQSVDKQDREWMGPLDIAAAIEAGEHLKGQAHD